MLLHELLHEVATGDEPPSRLTADEVYAAGQRRRRATVVVRIGAAAVLVVALVAALVVFAPARAPDNAGPAVVDAPGLTIEAVGGSDRDHLYALVRPCGGCALELRATADGGRTWVTRGTTTAVNLTDIPLEIHVTRAGVVGVFGAGLTRGTRYTYGATSLDQGRSFAGLSRTDTPVADAPADALVACPHEDGTDSCTVTVLDLDAGSVAPLAHQPDLLTARADRDPDGGLWAFGIEPGTGRPAVARSTDGGLTWTTHAFSGFDGFAVAGFLNAQLRTGGGGTALVSFSYRSDGDPAQLAQVTFRYADGRWQRLTGAVSTQAAYLTADGTDVVQGAVLPDGPGTGPAPSLSAPSWNPSGPPWSSPAQTPWSSGPALPPSENTGPARPGPRIVYWTCGPGETAYRQTDPPAGLPVEMLSAVERLPGGGYIAHGSYRAVFSDDGRTWTPIAIR